MDKDKLKLIVRNLELLVDSLKAEVYSDVSAYKAPQKTTERFVDYDELYDDDDDDVTSNININYRLVNDDDGDGI